MWNALKARLRQGYRTGKFPEKPPVLPDRFAGRAELVVEKCNGCGECEKVCPTAAVKIAEKVPVIDTGKCIFCGKCADACTAGALKLGSEYRLAAMSREKLLVDGSIYEPERPTDREFLKFCGNSLKIRQVSAGGCAACELDFNVLNTLAWDMGRFGIQVVASPRHADCILVTGPVSKNMLLALKKSYDAAPRPVWVIACGCCAISGGIYAGSPVCCDGVEEILKPDLYVPGCPPHPATLLEGILRLMNKKF
ncbi:MAG: 4Fe-4S binding protein [Lentisphaeria bacterium]|nr:4Fe-4S binding protein [Lentisphaeria bacterium]